MHLAVACHARQHQAAAAEPAQPVAEVAGGDLDLEPDATQHLLDRDDDALVEDGRGEKGEGAGGRRADFLEERLRLVRVVDRAFEALAVADMDRGQHGCDRLVMNSIVLSSIAFHDVATCGMILPSSSRVTTLAKMLR